MEFEKGLERFDTSILPESPIIVADSTHFCIGFKSEEEALAQIRKCNKLSKVGTAFDFVGKDRACSICSPVEVIKRLPQLTREDPRAVTFPFGDLRGNVDHNVKVIIPL